MTKFESLVLAIVLSFFLCPCRATSIYEDRKDYIIYMGSLQEGQYSSSAQHLSLLEEVVGGSSGKNYLIRSYTRSFNGFTARLTKKERRKLENAHGVISVFPNRILQLQTTRSWDFMSFNGSIPRQPTIESDIIIGVLDGGIWPESESFSDKDFGPIPKKWKGICEGGENFTCNNKLIGARFYGQAKSARDENGHGSHTASTAAGNEVKGVSFYGLAEGTAKGGVPSARIAAYKVCGTSGCPSAAILAGFDEAIADGVDIITISIGSIGVTDFDKDPIAIGAFHATEKGILVVNSGGNKGPTRGSTSSVAPWLLSVAASRTDRRIIDRLILGSGKEVAGVSVNTHPLPDRLLPLVYGSKASSSCDELLAWECLPNCIDENLVKGKILVCNSSLFGISEAFRAGAAGMVVINERQGRGASVVPLPMVFLTANETTVLTSYLESTRAPQAKLLKSEAVKDPTAPVVASFSSRGPNRIAPDILKPDIAAPGVEILAAFSPAVSPSKFRADTRSVKYNIISGTSMACPHVAGVAAYIKSIHPSWSPSTIKSAIMTTAWPMSPTKNTDAEFAYGAGHVNPLKATDPGLVYEISSANYIEMFCSLGYKETTLGLISGKKSACPEKDVVSLKNLNYPSLAATAKPGEAFSFEFPRKVTNVGTSNSTYTAKISSPSKIKVKVEPSTLSFNSTNETKSFTVIVTGDGLQEGETVSASLVWSDDTHSVRSPIVVYSPLK